MDLFSMFIQYIKDFIDSIGYLGIFFLMTLESMALPVPSEVIMTFGGWLAYDGRLDLFWVGMAGTLGCLAGSIIAYKAGEYGGRAFIKRYGKRIFLKESSMDRAEVWFRKHGQWAVFGSRLLPVVRTFISIPAGIAEMKFSSFVALTFLGSLIWCYALTFAGYYLGKNYGSLNSYFNILIIVVLIVVGSVLIYYKFRRMKGSEA